MPVRMRRRRVRKRKRPGENSGMKFTVFIVIMMLAVFLGYLTARFVIGPLLGYSADESPIKIAGQDEKNGSGGSEKNGEKNSGGDKSEKAADSEKQTSAESSSEKSSGKAEKAGEGYALQFGVFSTKEAAAKMANELSEKGIEAEVVEDENMYKVLSPVIKTKDEAIDRLGSIKDKEVEDVFIASF